MVALRLSGLMTTCKSKVSVQVWATTHYRWLFYYFRCYHSFEIFQ